MSSNFCGCLLIVTVICFSLDDLKSVVKFKDICS